MLAPAAIIIGDEQQALPFRSAVRVIQQRQACKMDAATLGEVNVRLPVDTRKPLAFDVVANLVERQAQALLAARLDPGDYDESVRGNGTSVAGFSNTPPALRICCQRSVQSYLRTAIMGTRGVRPDKLDKVDRHSNVIIIHGIAEC